MKNFDFKKMAVAMGILAMAGTNAMAEGYWQTTNKLQDPALLPGWYGMLTATADGVAEAWDAPFEVYQTITDAPAGEYTLTANAFYRWGTNDYAKANMADGANHNAILFLGDAKTAIEGLFDKKQDGCPNSTGEANAAFGAGEYVNQVKVNHAGGDLRFGIICAAYRQDMWCCFDNFKLVGPAGEVAVPNGDFAQGLWGKNKPADGFYGAWDILNVDASAKDPDINKEGGANGSFRKTNASPYNFGQLVELPAGKYRFGVQSFFRDGCGNQSGWYMALKGQGRQEGESSYDRHVAGTEDASLRPLVYVAEDLGESLKPLTADEIADITAAGKLYKETAVKCIFDEELSYYPDNEPKSDEIAEGEHGYADSGFEHEATLTFLQNPTMYRNYVEFELAAATKVWVGLKKDKNAPTHYWNPFRDFTLEKWVEGTQGIEGIEADENAPVEYYNLQGIRVAAPENGIFIVKQGNKVSKQIFK